MATNREKTGPRAASAASKVLRSPSAPKSAKSAAGSALSQAKSAKVTSPAAAKAAAKTLRNPTSSKSAKAASASALTQKPPAAGRLKDSHVKRSLAGSVLSQQVSTRKTANGKLVRVVLTQIDTGRLSRSNVVRMLEKVSAKPTPAKGHSKK